MITALDFIYLFAFLLWPFTLGGYYALVFIQAMVELRPNVHRRRSVLSSFALQCLVPVIGFPIFWTCHYIWKPFPDPVEWGSDLNGCIAFYITVGLALVLAFRTHRLATRNTR